MQCTSAELRLRSEFKSYRRPRRQIDNGKASETHWIHYSWTHPHSIHKKTHTHALRSTRNPHISADHTSTILTHGESTAAADSAFSIFAHISPTSKCAPGSICELNLVAAPNHRARICGWWWMMLPMESNNIKPNLWLHCGSEHSLHGRVPYQDIFSLAKSGAPAPAPTTCRHRCGASSRCVCFMV